MAQLVVRKLDDDVKERLRLRAARNGHSMEEEVREILLAAVQNDAGVHVEGEPGLGTRIARRFANLDEPFVLPERRFEPVRAVNFDDFEVPEDVGVADAAEVFER